MGTAILGFEAEVLIQENHSAEIDTEVSESRETQEQRRRELEKMKIRLEELGVPVGRK